jgi:hypothetical protein
LALKKQDEFRDERDANGGWRAVARRWDRWGKRNARRSLEKLEARERDEELADVAR